MTIQKKRRKKELFKIYFISARSTSVCKKFSSGEVVTCKSVSSGWKSDV